MDLVEEIRDQDILQEDVLKQRMAFNFSHKVIPKDFVVSNPVLRCTDVRSKNAAQGKLASNWEGPHRVAAKTGNGANKLEILSEEPIPKTWNATKT